MNLLWRVILLCLYAVVLFLIARLLEAFVWYETGHLLRRFVDPWSLSVKQLKLLLEQRGVSYHGAIEKQDLAELLEASGDVVERDIESSLNDQEAALPESRNFTDGGHFLEEVEDTKDSVWLIQVQMENHTPSISDIEWKMLLKKMSLFSIRHGLFDCSLDPSFCRRKNWFSPQILLAYPRGHRAKDRVWILSYSGLPRASSIISWIGKSLKQRIQTFRDFTDLYSEWELFKKLPQSRSSDIKVLILSSLLNPPMFLAILSVKFSGRVKIGTVDVNSKEGKNILNRLKIKKIPKYIIFTPEKNSTYGTRKGQYLTYPSMELYLRTLYPETNDIFIMSMLFTNVFCLMEFVIRQGSPIVRLLRLFIFVIKWNATLLIGWLLILAFLQFPVSLYVTNFLLYLVRTLSDTTIAASICEDYLYPPLSQSTICLSFAIFLFFVGIYEYIRKDGVDEGYVESDWWGMLWTDYSGYLFRPMVSITRPMSVSDVDLEEGMELLIERLAVPDLWLHPVFNTDYLKDLRIWQFERGTSASESDTESSDTGDESIRQSPVWKCQSSITCQNGVKNPADSCDAAMVMDGDYQCQCVPSCNAISNEKQPLNGSSQTPRSSPRPKRESKAPPGIIPCNECVICLDYYHTGQMLCGLPCGHAFHEGCIMEWLARDHHWCPLCRWPSYKSKPIAMHQHSD